MASSINASTAGAGGVITTADNSGVLNLQSGGVTVATINSTGIVMASNTAPACFVYPGSAQTIASSTNTIIQATVKTFDTNGCFNNTGSAATLNGISVPAWSFLPNIAGYYQINVQAIINTTSGIVEALILKNGSTIAYGTAGGTDGGNILSAVSQITYCNGTSDYIQYSAYQTSGTTKNFLIGANFNVMSIAMIRSA